jgi:NADPH:quinone reductase-like Zn-dependent oxidoreductase
MERHPDSDDRTTTTLEVRRDAVGETRLVAEAHDPGDLQPGQVRLRVDRFAITANNITYAVFGDRLGYWDFFPTGDPSFGRVPAMGWATVIESRADAISLGRRFYGWYPMSSHVIFTPTATKDGFRDDGAHRQAHAPVYRAYVATDADPMYPEVDHGTHGLAEEEDRHALLRGLFLTGFLAEEFFADGGGSGAEYFGAARVIVLSASSKTAIGFAQRAHRRGGIEVVGVTSPGNVEMVEKLGYYDRVVTYDAIDTVPTDGGAVSIDMAGNPASLRAVHERFGDDLAYSMTVGRSHHDAAPPTDAALPGPAPQLFFAPSEVGRRQEEWGRADYAHRCAAAISEFVDGSDSWMSVEHRVGPDAAEAAWADVYAGTVDPSIGIIAVVGDTPVPS